MFDPTDERDNIPIEEEDYGALSEQEAALEKKRRDKAQRPPVQLPQQPLFQTLFAESINAIDPNDAVLRDFAEHVAGPLSDLFGTVAAKGGDFYQMKKAQYDATPPGMWKERDTADYGHDQTMRAHLVNGMLPVFRIGKILNSWESKGTRYWNELAQRLFIAGFMLHDYKKFPVVKRWFNADETSEMEALTPDKIPRRERMFTDLCDMLGLDDFLRPVGGAQFYLHDLLYIAHNTQQYKDTARADTLLPNKNAPDAVLDLATKLSYLADLVTYVAPNPRELVAKQRVKAVFGELADMPDIPGREVARLTYHHVAENRGVLLNFIHDGALDALRSDLRIPLLYAPSGVVYLERYDAPLMPSPGELIPQIVQSIRDKAGEGLIEKGKGAKRGNVGLQVDDSYNDFFSLREIIVQSVRLVTIFIKNNKAEGRLTPIRDGGWPGSDDCPLPSDDPKDARLDQLAEWAGLMEVQFRERLPNFDLSAWLLRIFGIEDLAEQFYALRDYPEAKKGGIKYWWFWAAGHALKQKGSDPAATLEWLSQLAQELAAALPENLPEAARSNDDTWNDLADYIGRVLTLGGTKTVLPNAQSAELIRYTKAKGGRSKTICAICGSDYVTRKPAETAVSFQPGVYTARLPIGTSDNKRNLCSICALEQLLRQLFVENLDSGGSVEEQRVRYLSFYPSYFFTPETLNFVKRLYSRLRELRLSDKDFVRAMHDLGQSDPARFWQRLEPFLLRADDEEPSKRIVRYDSKAQTTFFMMGFRGFNKPADSESWVLPAFLALLLPICLDVKVVASESSIPLITEADEFLETVWFDGAHPALQAVIKENHVNVDQVLPTLQRLMAAYSIHLDTEYEPPKENWHRLVPIAHALMESPLYVFHYLKKQERDDRLIGAEQVRRYVHYAEAFFNSQGDKLMSKAKELVDLYRGFYRAKNTNANAILRPLSVISDALLVADMRLFEGNEALIELAYGELYRFMDRVGKGLADGRFPKGISVSQRETAMREFCKVFVEDVFDKIFRYDVAALRGKQLNLLRSACEVLYRNEQSQEWERNRAQGIESDDAADSESSEA